MYKLVLKESGEVVARWKTKDNMKVFEKVIKHHRVLRPTLNGAELTTVCLIEFYDDDNLYVAYKNIQDIESKALSVYDFVGSEIIKRKAGKLILCFECLADGRMTLKRG